VLLPVHCLLQVVPFYLAVDNSITKVE